MPCCCSFDEDLNHVLQMYEEGKAEKDKSKLILAACFIPSLVENLKRERAEKADLELQLKDALERY